MLEHMLESEHFYLCSALGLIERLPAPGAIVQKREGDLLQWMDQVRKAKVERIRSLNYQASLCRDNSPRRIGVLKH